MPTVAYALTTKEKVKSALGIKTSDHDDLIDSYINSVTDYIERQCGRRFKRTTHTNQLLDAKGNAKLFLPNYPIVSISALEYRGGTIENPTWNAYTLNDYLATNDEGIIRMYSALPSQPQFIRITYVAGYLIDFGNELDPLKHTLPFDLSQLATELVINKFQRRKSSNKTNESVEGQSVSWKDEMTEEQEQTLLSYESSYVF